MSARGLSKSELCYLGCAQHGQVSANHFPLEMDEEMSCFSLR